MTTLLVLFFFFNSVRCSSKSHQLNINNKVKTEIFLSPEFVLEPGLSSNKYYYDINFPHGHIALKSFNAELVDETGHPVPLHETYLHHWVLLRSYHRQPSGYFSGPDTVIIKNSGICDDGLTQYFGLGAETRRTATEVPDPYGIEVGDPSVVPTGYEEGWVLNVHAIDTRGAVDRLGCTECRCDLYNVTKDENGNLLPESYGGGVRCCHDGARCRVEVGFRGGEKRKLFLRYTVKYMEWEASIVPVKIYILDVTDVWTKGDESRHHCVVEYDVESCPVGDNDSCIHTKSLTMSSPASGDVIYGVGHQHAGATGTTLYGEGGRVICTSTPTYGTGDEAGNEAGYVVGMSTCYPTPTSVRINAGETLTLVSNYSNAQRHTGVMGLFYLLLADSSSTHSKVIALDQAHKNMKVHDLVWPIVIFGIPVIVVVVVYVLTGRRERGEGYEAML